MKIVIPAPQLSSIGKYRLIANIGHGGMAYIHLALMGGVAGFNKLLVIKALREDIVGGAEEFVTMFLDEARLAARLNHPNIVQTYEVGEADGKYFIAMEYLEGQSLKAVERRLSPGGLSQMQHLRIISDVAKGLHHAHELRGFNGEHLGVVHRDVSPHNVFLTYDGQVKLLDFGIAKAANAMHLTKVGVIKGKADYMAPEQIRGDEVDCRADIFSLGVMMWEAMSGKRFAGGVDASDVTKMHKRLTGGEEKLLVLNPHLPPRLIAICEKAIALNASDRHQTAFQLAQEIDDYLSESSLHPSARDLSERVTPAFKQEQKRLRDLVDEQMKRALDPAASFEGTTGSLPVLRNSQGSGVWTLPGAPGSSMTPSGVHITQSGVGGPALSQSQHMADTGQSAERRRTVPWAIVASVMAVAVVGAIYLGVRPADGAALPSKEVAAASQAVPRTDPPVIEQRSTRTTAQPGRVRLRIRVTPGDAEIRLDGALIQAPFDADVQEGRALHELKVTAAGYEDYREMLTYDGDRSVTVALERREAGNTRRRPKQSESVAKSGIRTEQTGPATEPRAAGGGESQPGMDFRRLGPASGDGKVVLEEDPYE